MEIIYGTIDYKTKLLINEMTQQQGLQDNYYQKIFIENGLRKKVETYSEQSLLAISYYIDDGEDETEIVNQLYLEVDYVSVFERKVSSGIYFIEREREYKKDNQNEIGYVIRVYDNQDRLVCYQDVDENDQPYISDETVKYCYISRTREVGDSTLYHFFLKFIYQSETEAGLEIPYGSPLYIEWHKEHDITKGDEAFIEDFNDINEVVEELGATVDYSYFLHPNWML